MRIRFDNYTIETCEEVYIPSEDSFALIDAIDKIGLSRGTFIDVGCGTGVIGIHVAKEYPAEVIFSDINPKAVRCSKKNASINRIRGEFILGDLLSRLSEASYAAFNPPYLRGIPNDLYDLSWSYERSIVRFLRQLWKIKEYAFLLLTEFNSINLSSELPEGFSHELILRRTIAGESYLVYLIARE